MIASEERADEHNHAEHDGRPQNTANAVNTVSIG
jgi:hypothetical protein